MRGCWSCHNFVKQSWATGLELSLRSDKMTLRFERTYQDAGSLNRLGLPDQSTRMDT